MQRIESSDPEQADELRSLLSAHERTDPLLDRSAPVEILGTTIPSARRPALHPGYELGRYRLLEKLGEGGMGAVYRAERADGGVEQRVAIKLLASASSSAESRQRFAAEREILARLEHPSIARLIDFGEDPEVGPFVVMEYVDGVPIDRYCHRQGLSLEARLELMILVCEAVDVAHRHLVVHRDLKPSNVLVTADGTPRLVDFGIASRLDLHEVGIAETAAFSPRWATPEVLRGDPVTAATDVYSLGLLLSHLLTGQLPDRPVDGPWDEALRAVLAAPRRLPSTLMAEVSSIQLTLPPPRWAGRLSGDVDAIVLRAVALKPSDRYRSASGLAADLRRFLGGFPVEARSVGPLGRLKMLVARRPWISTAWFLVGLMVAGFLVVTQALNLRLERALVRTELERTQALQTADFLRRLFEAATPAVSRGEPPSLEDMVARGTDRLLTGDPALADTVRIDLLLTLSEVQSGLSNYRTALEMAERARAASERLGDDGRIAASHRTAGRVHHSLGDYDRAVEHFRLALSGPPSAGLPDSVSASILSDLGAAQIGLEEPDAAERSLRQAVKILSASEDTGDQEAAVAQLRLGALLTHHGDLEEAETLLRQSAARLAEELGRDHPTSLKAKKEWADALRRLGRLGRAAEILEEVLADAEVVFGEEHAELAPILDRLSLLYQARSQLTSAEKLQRRALAIRIQEFDVDSARTTVSLNNLGWLLHDFGRFDEAETLYTRALAVAEKALGPDHPSVAISCNNLGLLALDRADPKTALPWLNRALEVLTKRLGPDHASRAFPLSNLGAVWLELGDLELAEAQLREALELRRQTLPPQHALLRPTLTTLGRLLCDTGRTEEGLERLEEAMTVARHAGSGGAYAEASTRFELGACQVRAGHEAKGRQLIDDALPHITERRGEADARVRRAAEISGPPLGSPG